MNKKVLLIFIAILAFIFGQSLLPGSASSAESSWIGDNILNPLCDLLHLQHLTPTHVRKLAHIAEFFALGAAAALLWRGKWAYGLFTGFTAAFLDESVQLFAAERGAMITDVWIDMVGVFLSVTIVHLIYKV